jgi:DNA-binding XRE family transcriptional regulator
MLNSKSWGIIAPRTKIVMKEITDDGLKIIDQEFYQGRPDRQAQLEQARVDDAVARKIYDLRTKAGLTQRQLAKLVGTTHSVISRLEDADYEGHSLAMLNRIAAAMDRRVEIRFVRVRAVSRRNVVLT